MFHYITTMNTHPTTYRYRLTYIPNKSLPSPNPSLEEDDIINIFDLETKTLISSLNSDGQLEDLCSLTFLDEGRKLAARDRDNSLCVWSMEDPNLKKAFDFHVEDARFFILPSQQYFMVSHRLQEVFQIKCDSLQVCKTVRLPEETVDIYFLPNGDLLLQTESMDEPVNTLSEMPGSNLQFKPNFKKVLDTSKYNNIRNNINNIIKKGGNTSKRRRSKISRGTKKSYLSRVKSIIPNRLQVKKKESLNDEDAEIMGFGEQSEKDFNLLYMNWENQPDKNNSRLGQEFPGYGGRAELPSLFTLNCQMTCVRVNSNLRRENTMVSQVRVNQSETLRNTLDDRENAYQGLDSSQRYTPGDTLNDSKMESNLRLCANSLVAYVGTEQQEMFRINVSLFQNGKVCKKTHTQCLRPLDFERLVMSAPTPDALNKTQILSNTNTKDEDQRSEGTFVESSRASRKESKSISRRRKKSVNKNSDHGRAGSELQPVHDFGRFADLNVEYCVYCRENEETGNQECVVDIGWGKELLSRLSIDLGASHHFSRQEFFKVLRLPSSKKKRKKESSQNRNKHRTSLCVYNTSGVALVDLVQSSSKRKVKLVRFLKKEIDLEAGLFYSGRNETFYISNSKCVQVWDRLLASNLYNIDTGNPILKLHLSEETDTLIVYDARNYLEISTINLEFKRQLKWFSKKREGRSLPLNFALLPSQHAFSTSRWGYKFGCIRFVFISI